MLKGWRLMTNEQDNVQYINVPDNSPPSFPNQQKSDRADLLDKIKPEQIVEIIRQRLLGNDFVDGVWKPNPALKSRALSEIGAWEISNLILGTASINTSISKLEDHEIKRRLLNIADTAQMMCLANWQKYEIKNSTQLQFVHAIIFTNGLVVLKQADGASIQELLKGTVYENRNIQSEPKRESRIKRMLGL